MHYKSTCVYIYIYIICICIYVHAYMYMLIYMNIYICMNSIGIVEVELPMDEKLRNIEVFQTHCNTLHNIATHFNSYNTLQHTYETHCNTVHHNTCVAMCCTSWSVLHFFAVCCNVFGISLNTLQHTISRMTHTATKCNTWHCLLTKYCAM